MDHSREKIEVFEVDENGELIENYSWDAYEINEAIDEGRNIIQHRWKRRLFKPVWDFESKAWIEGLSSEEIEKEEAERRKPSLSEVGMQALAILELAIEIEKLKGGH